MKKKKVEDPLKDFKKARPKLSKASVKRICSVKTSDTAGCRWMERWIDQLVRERSYPPQLVSDDFYSLLQRYFEPRVIIEILEKARHDYRRAFPLTEEEDDTLEWLLPLLKSDSAVMADLPPTYL